jgi:hypothetical protein
MKKITPEVPAYGNLDVLTLSRLFVDQTNSYKILFFRSLLRAFVGSNFHNLTFRLEDLAIQMLVDATYPVLYFRLSLGSTDQIHKILSNIEFSPVAPFTTTNVRAAVKPFAAEVRGLLRYVPTRLLSPFFIEDLREQPDHLRDGIVERLANERFEVAPVLYRLTAFDNLELHPRWADFLNRTFR